MCGQQTTQVLRKGFGIGRRVVAASRQQRRLQGPQVGAAGLQVDQVVIECRQQGRMRGQHRQNADDAQFGIRAVPGSQQRVARSGQ